MKEIWKWVKDLEDVYEVSNLGRVKSLEREVWWRWWSIRIKYEKILSIQYDSQWYPQIRFSIEGKRFQESLAKITYKTFNWEMKKNQCISHKDWDVRNCRKDNLVIWNRKNNWKVYRKINQFTRKWKLIKIWSNMQQITDELWIILQSISNNCRWKTQSAWWFIWKYKD